MFFLTRAAACIGLVALAASNAGGPGLASAVDQGMRGAAAAAGQACLRSSDCLRMGAGLLTAATPLASGVGETGTERVARRDMPVGAAVPLPPPRPQAEGPPASPELRRRGEALPTDATR